MPLVDIFGKGLTMRHGQCHVRAWTDGLLELAELPNDPLELQGFATHHAPFEDAAEMYAVPGEAGRLHQGHLRALSTAAVASSGQTYGHRALKYPRQMV